MPMPRSRAIIRRPPDAVDSELESSVVHATLEQIAAVEEDHDTEALVDAAKEMGVIRERPNARP